MKKHIRLALATLLLAAMMFAAWQIPASAEAKDVKDLTIGIIYLTSEHPYYQAHAEHTRNYATELGFNLREIDGKLDQANMATQMENLIAQKVDGIVYCLLEATPASVDINAAQDAGIPVVTFAIKHDDATASCPFVGLDEFDAGRLGGIKAGELYLEKFPSQQANVTVIEAPGVQATINRSDGFFAGFSSVVTDANLVIRLDGNGQKEKAMNVTEDVLQSHPEINVFFGSNGDQGLGALAALEAQGRGTLDTELVVSHDGSEPEVLKIIDPTSALKIANANRPKACAQACIDTLLEIINGERDMKDTSDILVETAVITGEDINACQEFIRVEYCSTTQLPGATN